MNPREIKPCGDDLISIGVGQVDVAQEVARQLRKSGAWREAVGGIDSVVVQFDPAAISMDDAMKMLRDADHSDAHHGEYNATLVEIPVRYGGEHGPDLDTVCTALALSRDELITMHCSDEYPVEMLGFTPGFAYIGGLDARLDVPRMARPRQRVEAGSIGIAGGRTGIYALPGPGGWPLIGRTSLPLFDAQSEEAFLLRPGMRVRFIPVGD